MAASGMTEEKIKAGNMPVIFGVSFVLSVILALQMAGLSIHQNAVASLFIGVEGFGVEGSEVQTLYDNFFAIMGDHHRSYTHGLAHGLAAGLLFVLPVLGTNALFEGKGFRYIAINVGYWIVTLMLMGAVISQFAPTFQ